MSTTGARGLGSRVRQQHPSKLASRKAGRACNVVRHVTASSWGCCSSAPMLEQYSMEGRRGQWNSEGIAFAWLPQASVLFYTLTARAASPLVHMKRGSSQVSCCSTTQVEGTRAVSFKFHCVALL